MTTSDRRSDSTLDGGARMPRLATHSLHYYAWATIAAGLLLTMSGCAAMTNPIANGVPVRELPLDLLAEPKELKQTIPLSLLRGKPESPRHLSEGDILGIYIE